MEAKNTVMTRRQQVECSHNPVGELRERDMCEAQAEISFKAGKQVGLEEVVEWVKYVGLKGNDPLGRLLIGGREWQAKLKSWNISD